ncbi:MAG: anaerobic carbon-monoxide dehydrogenase catalytic subunit [Candidatus Omnitrophota bacterium]|jgi:carbon-monoxide dehydrogenase catalytic subunit|nr:anaerobic carbon-monoxide dehydrogenase catalytic subunit [Candidatus Omnitrophota bacterium]
MASETTGNPVYDNLIDIARKENIKTLWDRFEAQQPRCGFGTMGVCCKICNLGPCRIDPFGEGPQVGACGADRDIIAARNLARNTAAGSACHSDHGRDLAKTLLEMGRGHAKDYKISDPVKLKKLAQEFGIKIEGKNDLKIAEELGEAVLKEYGQQEGHLTFTKRAPKKQQEIWNKLKVNPTGIDMEVVRAMSRTHMGCDNEFKHLIQCAMRTSMVDGWGGSMVATELSDILFGSPQPLKAEVNLGVLKKDEINVLLHGHEPTLSDMIVTASQDKEIIDLAKKSGAKGLNLSGICCTASEVLMRHGLAMAGNFLQQELAILTGAVEAMVVDVQCIMPSLPEVAKSFHTKLISTSPKAQFKGMKHIEFNEKDALKIAKDILKEAIENYKNRDHSKVNIPKETTTIVAGFTTENVFYNLGGTFRSSYRPLNDAIISGRLRGVAGVVGCDNPKNKSSLCHADMVKYLIKNDVLVVQTGCSAGACGKAGLLIPETAIKFAGKGLREICETVGIPPILHTGSCVDNTRILTACCEMVKEGGLGNGIDELPVAGAAPEWMSEKAIAIGWYFVTSGLLVVLGTPLRVLGSKNVRDYITKEIEPIVGGKWAFENNPIKGAQIMIDHINKKREALKLGPMMYEEKTKATGEVKK